MKKFQGNRISNRYIMNFEAKPEDIFPLLCPKRELEWLDGWDYDMVYSATGVAELGCIFMTNMQPEGEAYWIMTRYIPPIEVEYVKVVAGLAIISLNINLKKQEYGTEAEMVRSFTGISDRGNELVSKHAGSESEKIAERMEKSLNHFLRTGKKLKLS